MSGKEHSTVTTLRKDLDRNLERIANIRNNADRSRAALQAADMLRLEYTKKFGEIRQHAVAALYHEEGYTLAEISELLGIGVARAQQLVSGITPALRKKWQRSSQRAGSKV